MQVHICLWRSGAVHIPDSSQSQGWQAWGGTAGGLLGTYSVLLVIMLLVQAAVAITLFADDSWRKYLPPDQTGEFHKVLKSTSHSFPAP